MWKKNSSELIFHTAPYGPENTWKYGNYSHTSFIRTTLFHQKMSVWQGIWNQTCRHVGHSGAILLKFFVLLQILFCQENFLLKTIIKIEVETPTKMFCARPQTFRPRLRVWPKRTLKGEIETNCRVRRTVSLSKYVDCMWNMTKWNSHTCFCLLADLYTQATMHSEWDSNAKKLYRRPITASCRVCHCYIHCV